MLIWVHLVFPTGNRSDPYLQEYPIKLNTIHLRWGSILWNLILIFFWNQCEIHKNQFITQVHTKLKLFSPFWTRILVFYRIYFQRALSCSSSNIQEWILYSKTSIYSHQVSRLIILISLNYVRQSIFVLLYRRLV